MRIPIPHQIIDGKEKKYCNFCKEWKEVSLFAKHTRSIDGLNYKCKECTRVYKPTKHKSSEIFRKKHEIIDGIEKKECCTCHEYLPLEKFNKCAYKWDGIKPYCNECSKRDYYEKYRTQHLKNNKIWREKNKKTHSEYKKKWMKEKMKTDINYRLLIRHRSRINDFIKRNRRSLSSRQLLGCSLDEFKQHLEQKFTEGMNWDNYGKWHLDHIIPCCKFNLSNEEELKKCFHYTNYQPLWAIDNARKGGRIL